MDIGEGLVSYLLRFSKKQKLKSLELKKKNLSAIRLSDIKESLAIFASAVFELPIEIRETNDYPYISGVKLFLPEFMAFGHSIQKNKEAFEIAVLNIFAISRLHPPLLSAKDFEDEFEIIKPLIPEAIELLQKKYPNYHSLYHSFHFEESVKQDPKESVGFNLRCLWGRLPRKASHIEAGHFIPEVREALPEGMTERKSPSKGTIKKIDLDENKENIGQDVFHHFEKVETAEEYKGVQRDTDGSDQLAQHADALEDLNLEDVIRSSKATNSLYKTELDMGFEVTDLLESNNPVMELKTFFYDEWDEKKRLYKKDWCRILHLPGETKSKNETDRFFYQECVKKRSQEISRLKKKLIQLASEIRIEKKLYFGRSIDIDNVIRNTCLRKNGNSGDQRYYQETKKRHRDMACLLLVDTSLSSDSWVQNRRILDVSLDALITFGEASQALGDPIMIAGFNSNTRNECKFIEWKSFDAPWSKFCESVDSITPAGYTRIGPAIRHATKLLTERKEKHKLLLIFTDGRPTDFDRYEGHYGLGDVRQAIREADRDGVVCFAIAIDPTAKQFLPRLFGLGNFQIMNHLESMPEVLTKLYGRLAKM